MLERGALVLENRRGRTSHESSPTLMAGTRAFDEERGEVWAAHLGWSGNHHLRVEALPDGRRLRLARRAAAARRDPARAGRDVRDADAVRGVLRPRARRGQRRVPRARARACRPRHDAATGHPQHLGGGLLPPRRARAAAPRRRRRVGRRRAVRARRRLVPRPRRRHDLARRLVRRRAEVPERARRAGRPRRRPRHGVRPVGRARDGQRGQRPVPRAPRVGARHRGPGAGPRAQPAGARPRSPRGVGVPARPAAPRC